MAILNTHLPFAPWMQPAGRKLPGVMPLDPDDWLLVDDAYSAQMAERARLLAEREADVLAVLPEAEPAAQELYDLVLPRLPALGFSLADNTALRPDGVTVPLDRDSPLWTLGHLLQEDFCILQKPEGAAEHVLTGAVLCFPSGWYLSQKLGRALLRIHAPVTAYDPAMAARVQRMFDLIRPEQPLWRANLLRHDDPKLYHPREEFVTLLSQKDGRYLRSEKQCLLKLPRTGAVVFSIHTVVVPVAQLAQAQQKVLSTLTGHG